MNFKVFKIQKMRRYENWRLSQDMGALATMERQLGSRTPIQEKVMRLKVLQVEAFNSVSCIIEPTVVG